MELKEIAKNYWFVEHKNIMNYLKQLREGKNITITKFSGMTKALCTSGSTTGNPNYIFVDKEQLELRFAAEWWTMEWTGWKYGEKWAHLWYPQVREHHDNVENLKKLEERRKLENCLFLNYFNLDSQKMRDYYNKFKEFKPKVLVGYSEAVFIFARFLKENNLSLNIPAVITSGGHLYSEWRPIIEKAFNTKVWNRYGCSQFGVIAMEDWRDDGKMKVITQRGLSLKDTKNRPLLVTDINNKARELKDYDLGDLGSVKNNIITELYGKLKSGKSYLRIYWD